MHTTEDGVGANHHGKPAGRSLAFWSAVLATCLGVLVFLLAAPGPQPPQVPDPPQPSVISGEIAQARFFDEEIQPAIAEIDNLNREAAERCLRRIRDVFDTGKSGVRPFTNDLASLGTRFGILRRMPSDWWRGRQDVLQFVAEKFEAHLFSDESLATDIDDALNAFRQEIEANNTTLLANVQAAVSRSHLPSVELDYSTFSSELTSALHGFASDSAKDSVVRLLVTELASGVGGVAARKITVAIGTRIAAMAGTTAAAAGGVTAGGTAAGAGGGTATGPIGTAVGAAAGLVVGVTIDWWMTARFEEELRGQLSEMIDQIESSVIHGTEDRPGLQQALYKKCDFLHDAYRTSLYERIVMEPLE